MAFFTGNEDFQLSEQTMDEMKSFDSYLLQFYKAHAVLEQSYSEQKITYVRDLFDARNKGEFIASNINFFWNRFPELKFKHGLRVEKCLEDISAKSFEFDQLIWEWHKLLFGADYEEIKKVFSSEETPPDPS